MMLTPASTSSSPSFAWRKVSSDRANGFSIHLFGSSIGFLLGSGTSFSLLGLLPLIVILLLIIFLVLVDFGLFLLFIHIRLDVFLI